MNKIIIEKEKLQFNIDKVKEQANKNDKPATIIAVLKANAYGVGMDIMSQMLIENKINFFAVTHVFEAIKLKSYGHKCDILVLNSTCIESEIDAIIQNDFIASCGSLDSIIKLEESAKRLKKEVRFHLNIDTGMSRFGIRADELLKTQLDSESKEFFINEFVKLLSNLKHAKMTGIYTHFQQSYAKKSDRTREQFNLFINVINRFKSLNFDVGLKHCCNTSAFFRFPEMHLDAVRVGSAFSGRSQSEVSKNLRKVGYLQSHVCEVREIKNGDRVFYSGMFKAKKDMKVGVVEAGYSDGFELSGPRDCFSVFNKLLQIKYMVFSLFKNCNNYVSINGKSCMVLGRIGMKNFVVDLSSTNAEVGDLCMINIPLSICPSDIPTELI